MKKPTTGVPDALRALLDDPALREFGERYEAAQTPEEREAAFRAFIEAADAHRPDWRETEARGHDDGSILRAMFIHCMVEARRRQGLSEFEHFAISEAEATFKMIFDALGEAPPGAAAVAFRLAQAALDMALFTTRRPSEVEKIRNAAVALGRRSWMNPRLEKHGIAIARDLAREIAWKNQTLSDEDIVVKIIARWSPKEKLPGHRTLARHVSKWREDKTLPPRPN